MKKHQAPIVIVVPLCGEPKHPENTHYFFIPDNLYACPTIIVARQKRIGFQNVLVVALRLRQRDNTVRTVSQLRDPDLSTILERIDILELAAGVTILSRLRIFGNPGRNYAKFSYCSFFLSAIWEKFSALMAVLVIQIWKSTELSAMTNASSSL